MSLILFIFLLLIIAYLAGLLGSLTGLGGGVIIIPALTLIFHINIHYAMGASLISVIATSSGSASAHRKANYTNIRVGLFLEVAAVCGAFGGALLVSYLSRNLLAFLFSLILFFSAYMNIKTKDKPSITKDSHPLSQKLKLSGSYLLDKKMQSYSVHNVKIAFSLMGFAGFISGLLGIGSGALKVLAMDQALRLPYKVATSTSNFMIGMTAAVSASIYFASGYIHPVITCPVMLGVLAGSFSGAKLLTKLSNTWLRSLFSIAIGLIGIQMFYKALIGGF